MTRPPPSERFWLGICVAGFLAGVALRELPSFPHRDLLLVAAIFTAFFGALCAIPRRRQDRQP